MANHHGDFIWYELLTSDVDAAAVFYGAVLGWQARSAGLEQQYHTFGVDGFGIDRTEVAGLMALPEEAANSGMRPVWLGYIGVDDVDATASGIVAAGGEQYVPPTDVPGVGRFAMVTDPQGAVFYVMRGAVDGTSTAFTPMKPGHCQWNELSTSDQGAALAFYSSQFGWKKGDAMPMGAMGTYQLIEHQGEALGAMMTGTAGEPPLWMFYFGVVDIDAAAQLVTSRGGTIEHGPIEVPGGVFSLVASDPQGASFGLVGPRK